MRSQYNNTQKFEKESRLYFENICFQCGWKFRSYGQENDIDGEIEIFDKVNKNGKEIDETKAEFVKVQLKSSANLEYKDNYVKFNCPVKLLHFVDVCDQPIILILYDVNKKKAYYLWLHNYIYTVLDNENSNWRNNLTTVTLYIMVNNEVNKNGVFENYIEEIGKKGIKEITQLRKKDTIDYYITELSHEDMSNVFDRRISIKILVEKSFSESRDAMRILINKLNNRYKKSDYFRDKNTKHLHSENVDVLWLYFYNDIRQEKDGLPYCRTEWINPKSDVKISKMNGDEMIDNINISWGEDYKILEENYVENRMSKGKYMPLLDDTFESIRKLESKLDIYFTDYKKDKISEKKLINTFKGYSERINELYTNFERSNLPPYECDDIDQKMVELLISLDNIGVCLNDSNRDIKNKLWAIKFYYNDFKEKIPEYLYERKKIR